MHDNEIVKIKIGHLLTYFQSLNGYSKKIFLINLRKFV